ncbi:hypothetical protein IFHNHDMJ_02418 [Synechococcus sp. CBW1107]|nr:hypothetical protein IFHNHDMJ_02418 [Synechococcus sp. CBW1107]
MIKYNKMVASYSISVMICKYITPSLSYFSVLCIKADS